MIKSGTPMTDRDIGCSFSGQAISPASFLVCKPERVYPLRWDWAATQGPSKSPAAPCSSPSIARSRVFVKTPPFAEKPPILPPAATTRWDGTIIANGFRARACVQRREASPRRRSVPRERRRSTSRPGECYARPRRRGGGMAARGPCPAERMKIRPARRANTRRNRLKSA
jgi:hypothetical protein